MNKDKLTELEYVLLHFLAEVGPTHPYHLGRVAEERGGKDVVSLGALYKALHRLEKGGCVSSEEEDIDPREAKRPRRHIYEITGVGELALQRAVETRTALLRPAVGEA